MLSIKIKGRITPYTPTYHNRPISLKELPEELKREFFYLHKKDKSYVNFKVNGRECRGSFHSRDNFIMAYPTDEPASPKKPRITEQRADEAFIQFCQSGDWERLLNRWKWTSHWNFRKRLLKRLDSITFNKKNCKCCDIKFSCFTERHNERV